MKTGTKAKTLIIAIAVWLMLVTPAVAGNLFTFVIDMGSHPCDGRLVRQQHGGPSDATWYVVKMEIWRGMSVNAVADFWTGLTLSDVRFMGGNNWDRYAPTSGMHTMIYDYSPHWFAVHVGGWFIPELRCTDQYAWGGLPSQSNGHSIITLWYTYEPPPPGQAY